MITKYYDFIKENYSGKVFYHGSTDKSLSGKRGVHVGTLKAATQALCARIGIPAEGTWDGHREYGKTLLAGNKTLKKLRSSYGYYIETGFNCNAPEDDYYPDQRKEKAKYSDGNEIPMDCKPTIFPVKIIGKMTNSIHTPYDDSKANGMMIRNLKMGNAKSGYYYTNIGEDNGSISAVVPNGSFLEVL